MKKIISGILVGSILLQTLPVVSANSFTDTFVNTNDILSQDLRLYETTLDTRQENIERLVKEYTSTRYSLLAHNEIIRVKKPLFGSVPEIRFNVLQNDFSEEISHTLLESEMRNEQTDEFLGYLYSLNGADPVEELEGGLLAEEYLETHPPVSLLEGETEETAKGKFQNISSLPKLPKVSLIDPMDFETEEEMAEAIFGVDPIYFESDEKIAEYRETLAAEGMGLEELFDEYYEEWKKRGRITVEDYKNGIFARLDEYGLKGGIIKMNGDVIIPAWDYLPKIYSLEYPVSYMIDETTSVLGAPRFAHVYIEVEIPEKTLSQFTTYLLDAVIEKLQEDRDNNELLSQTIDAIIEDLEDPDFIDVRFSDAIDAYNAQANTSETISKEEIETKKKEALETLKSAKEDLHLIDMNANPIEKQEKTNALIMYLQNAKKDFAEKAENGQDNVGNDVDNSDVNQPTDTVTKVTNLATLLSHLETGNITTEELKNLQKMIASEKNTKDENFVKVNAEAQKIMTEIIAKYAQDEKFLKTDEGKNLVKNISRLIAQREEIRKKICETCTTSTPMPPGPGGTGTGSVTPDPDPTPDTHNSPGPKFSMEFKNIPQKEFKKMPEKLPATGTQKKMTRDKEVVTYLNPEFLRLAGSSEIDIDFWKQVLPEVDKNADKILVVPSKWLVIPVNTVETDNWMYKSFINGNSENFYSYLLGGSVELPGSSAVQYGDIGNKAIAGHSSYWKQSISRYKTHFQTIIGLEENSEVWVYVQNASGEYDRHVYMVTSSYETSDSDTSVLEHSDKSEITLITCTPVGGIQGRWIVKAELVK